MLNYFDSLTNGYYFAHMLSSKNRKLNRILPGFALLFIVLNADSQDIKTKQADWQQSVDYEIKVSLNDIDHLLTGQISIRYVNNSPDELTYIMMHLWPNAYKNNQTAFAMQQLGNGSSDFYYAKDEERGWIDSLDFKVNGAAVKWAPDGKHIDIARLELAEPLKPGDTLLLETPFKVKIPGSFSRFGHVKNGYQITQWYPKPAVYDVNGWNAMPYLDQGEFYSEYGSFHVEITLPRDYVVSATGELQEEEEWEFLEKREGKPLSAELQKEKRDGLSSSVFKTITFKQDRIHDFAWFADPTFNVTTDKLQLPSGDTVTVMIFTTEEYEREKCDEYVSYTRHALMYYSQNIGIYPYAYCSVVQGALVAGGGMEYPMVTVIPNLNEGRVIVHEVGHNWFYGILGNDERRYPWMDEAINSYYENRAMDSYNNKTTSREDPLAALNLMSELGDMNSLAFRVIAVDAERKFEHQPIGAHSESFTWINYGAVVYGKGASAFSYLEAYLGHNTLDQAFKSYFDNWQFRHPLPGDLKAVFEEVSGKDLSWFFDDYLVSDGILDYSLEFVNKVTVKARIRNEGDIVAPFPVDYILGDKIVRTIWVEGFSGEKEVDLLNIEYSTLKIDAMNLMGETYTRNNTYRLNKTFPTLEPARRNRFFTLEDPNRTQLSVMPALGWNTYDNFMVGLCFSNIRLPRQKFEFVLAPMYGFGLNQVTGYGDIRYTNYYKNSKFSSSQIGLNVAQFSHEMPGIYRDTFTWLKISPVVKLNLAKPNARSKIERSISLRATWLNFMPSVSDKDKLASIEATDTSRRSSFVNPDARTFIRLRYENSNDRVINPYSFRLSVENGMVSNTTTWLDSSKTTDDEVFVKLDLIGKYRVSYPFHDKGLDIRVFAGGFIKAPEASAFQLAYNNTNNSVAHPDYQYEYSQLGRGMQNGLFTHQLIEDGPYLKNIGMLFMADQWLAAVNLESGLPFKFPLGVYMDFFTSNNMEDIQFNEDEAKIGYSGGIHLDMLSGMFKVYAPLFASAFITDAQEFRGIDKFTDRITFTLNLNLFNPFSLREEISKMM